MRNRILYLRGLEPGSSGQASYVAILEAAAGLFRQVPADAITLRDILSTSGVSTQTLYNYFPSGRDDVALVLLDRFQRALLHAFEHNNQSIPWERLGGGAEILKAISASLARATFSYLKQNREMMSGLHGYLERHHLGARTALHRELEEALEREIVLRLGDQYSARELPQVVHLGAKVATSLADTAMSQPDFSIERLESLTRKLLRILLWIGLKEPGGEEPRGAHSFPSYTPPPIAIVGAPISPAKQNSILERIYKRNRKA